MLQDFSQSKSRGRNARCNECREKKSLGMTWLRSFLASALLLSTVLSVESACPRRRVCYYGSWAVYRWGNGLFDVEHIDPFLCTHIFYGFVGINVDATVRIMDSWNEVDKGALRRFNDLKKKNPNLKTLLACGGWNEGSEKFSKMAASPALRTVFVQSALNLVRTYNYDGFDLDWEYPAQRGGTPQDKQNFILLLQEFRREFDKYGLLVTAAVASAEASASQSYNVPEVSKYLDFINVMTYDLHGAWDGVTGHNSPLYPSSADKTDAARSLNTDACIRWWLAKGADRCKIVVGIGLYGRTFTLADPNNNEIGAPAWNGGTAGPYTQESGFLGYNEIIERFLQGGWTFVWDDEQKVPYAYKGNQWVGYDNERSIQIKAEYVKTNDLGGIIIWSLETDDFKGLSGTVNPLLNAIKNNLENGQAPQPTQPPTQPPVEQPTQPPTQPPVEQPTQPPTQPPVEQPTQPPTQPPVEQPTQPPTQPPVEQPTQPPTQPPVEQPTRPPICTKEELVRDPVDCKVFYNCQRNGDTFIEHRFVCQGDTVFDPSISGCNWSSQVSCN